MQKAKQTIKANQKTTEIKIPHPSSNPFALFNLNRTVRNVKYLFKTTKKWNFLQITKKSKRKQIHKMCQKKSKQEHIFPHQIPYPFFNAAVATASVQFWCFICFHFYRSPYSLYFFCFCFFIANIKKVFQYLTLAICTQQQASSQNYNNNSQTEYPILNFIFSFFSITE